MSLSTLIDKIMGKQQERERVRAADFQGIVQQIAAGEEPDADRVDAVLREAGKTLDDLRVAVEKLQRRRELKAKLDSLPKLVAQRRDVERKMADANRLLEQAEQRHLEETAPLEARIQDLKEQIWAAERARAELWNSCEDAALTARLQEVLDKTAALRQESAALRSGSERSRGLAESDRARADRLVSDSRSDDLRIRADEHDADVVRLQARLKAVEKEIATLQKQEAAIQDEMLVP